MTNEQVLHFAELSIPEACRECVVRDIMSVDRVEYDEVRVFVDPKWGIEYVFFRARAMRLQQRQYLGRGLLDGAARDVDHRPALLAG
jgi:hypothetical protein